MKLTHEDVQEILQILESSAYDELELETEGFRLTLRRAGTGQWTGSSEVTAEPNVLQPAATRPDAKPGDAPAPNESRAGLIEVRTPLPGTFYRAPQPGAPPFVDVGDTVEENTVVCIVETMKLMNSVHAGTRGTVVEICLENAQPVEQHAVLMRIEPKD